MTQEELDDLSEQLGDGPGARAKRRNEIERMSVAKMEAEVRGVQEEIKRRRSQRASRLPLVLMLLCFSGQAVEVFTTYDCSNRSYIVESYSLLEPDPCANMGKEGEVETTVYGEIVKIKQDRMISVFRCIVIETIISRTVAFSQQRASRGKSAFGNPGHWRPGSAARRGRAGKSSSTAEHFKARSERQPCTACSWPGDSTLRATARWESSPFPMDKHWVAKQHRGCMRSLLEKNLPG